MMSWWYIFLKMFALKRALRVTNSFESEFWGGGDINAMYQRVSAERESAGEMERIFEAGFREFMKLRRQAGLSSNVIIDGTRRAMRATYQRELDGLESHLSFLATVGSVSPYVGLFGTVWGIMLAFQGLATVAQATLAQVARRHRRGADRHRHGAVLRDSRRGRLQPLHRTTSTGWPIAWKASWKSFQTSCSGSQSSRRKRGAFPQTNRPDQRRADDRRDAGAARHIHGDGALHQPRSGRSAERQQDCANAHRSRWKSSSRNRANTYCATVRPAVTNARCQSPNLAAEIAALHRAQPDQPVVIAADKNVRYEEVMNTMSMLQNAQITRIGLLARPAP